MALWREFSCMSDGYKLFFCCILSLFLTYCQSFLLISCSLHNPPRPSRHSSWQADEITVSDTEQRQGVRCILNMLIFCVWTAEPSQSQSRSEQTPLWFETCGFFYLHTCFCLVTRSQSSTSQGFSSSGIFTFTSTRFANISSWWSKNSCNRGILELFLSQLQECRGQTLLVELINIKNIFALVAHWTGQRTS